MAKIDYLRDIKNNYKDTISNLSRALSHMCEMLDRVMLQHSGFRKIIAQKSIEIDELKEEIAELEYTTEHLRKEKEDLEKHVTRN